MRRLADQIRRIRWLAVPLGAYLAITLVLPALNGAAAAPGFGRHAAWVLGGCAATAAVTLVAGAATDLVRAGARGWARRQRTRTPARGALSNGGEA